MNKDEVTVYSLHPGVVRTDLGRHIEGKLGIFKYLFWGALWPFTKNPVQGAQTSIYCAVEEEISGKYYKVQTQMTQFLFLTKYVEFFLKYIFIGHSGRYYSDCQEKPEAPLGQDDETAEKLWDLSVKLVNL